LIFFKKYFDFVIEVGAKISVFSRDYSNFWAFLFYQSIFATIKKPKNLFLNILSFATNQFLK